MLIGIDASRAVRSQATGTETYSVNLIRALIKNGRHHRYRLYLPEPPPQNLWPSPLPNSVELRVIPFPRLWTQVRLAWDLYRFPPDILFVPAHVMPVLCPVPGAVTVHDLGYLHYPQAHRPFDRWYLDWTTRRHARQAQLIVADSQATKNDLCHYYAADPSRVEVIYPGRNESIGPVEDPATIADAKARYGIDGEYFLYLGTLQPRKNLERLVRAFAQFRENDQAYAGDLKLVLAGKKGWLYQDLMAAVTELSLQEQVIIPGYVDDGDKAPLISGARALVFPSLYEGFGLPVLEAMACRTPVLTSNCSSLPEVAGDAALLVDPHNTQEIAAGLSRLATEAELRQLLVEKGWKQVQKFSWEAAANQLLEALEMRATQLDKGSSVSPGEKDAT